MITGDKTTFAIEWSIAPHQDYSNPFVKGAYLLHINGQRYGVEGSEGGDPWRVWYQIGQRLAQRGQHQAPFAEVPDGGEIAAAFVDARNSGARPFKHFIGLSAEAYGEFVTWHLLHLPDGFWGGDESYHVLQFDVGERVRVLGFRTGTDKLLVSGSIADIWMDSGEFYRILALWHSEFEAEYFRHSGKKLPLAQVTLTGDKSTFAIEWCLDPQWGFDHFIINGLYLVHINGKRYGIDESDAGEIWPVWDDFRTRIERRGRHVAPFAEMPAGEIADAWLDSRYVPDRRFTNYFGLSAEDFSAWLHKNDIELGDGCPAFDDGSHVFHFDVGDRVRLIGFQGAEDYRYEPDSLSDLWMEAEDFYNVLTAWCAAFEAEYLRIAGRPPRPWLMPG